MGRHVHNLEGELPSMTDWKSRYALHQRQEARVRVSCDDLNRKYNFFLEVQAGGKTLSVPVVAEGDGGLFASVDDWSANDIHDDFDFVHLYAQEKGTGTKPRLCIIHPNEFDGTGDCWFGYCCPVTLELHDEPLLFPASV